MDARVCNCSHASSVLFDKRFFPGPPCWSTHITDVNRQDPVLDQQREQSEEEESNASDDEKKKEAKVLSGQESSEKGTSSSSSSSSYEDSSSDLDLDHDLDKKDCDHKDDGHDLTDGSPEVSPRSLTLTPGQVPKMPLPLRSALPILSGKRSVLMRSALLTTS